MSDAPLILAPSILAADFAHLGDAARAVEGAADWLHVDVMDNHFVPNLTFGRQMVDDLHRATTLPLDVHLMIENPDRWAIGYAEAGAHNVSFHAEACDDPATLAKDLRAAGSLAGLAIDRDTPVEPYLDLMPHLDTLLIMTIKAGFGGQRFIPELLDKVRAARRHAASGHLHIRIEVDGGIDEDSIVRAAVAGADAFVAGTSVYRSADPASAVRALRQDAQRARGAAGNRNTPDPPGAGTIRDAAGGRGIPTTRDAAGGPGTPTTLDAPGTGPGPDRPGTGDQGASGGR